MNARREPVPRASEFFPDHVFEGDPDGYRDPIRQKPVECLYVVDGRRCKFPRENAVHKTSEELAKALPPTHPDDRSDAIIGDRAVPDPPSRES